MRGRDYDWGVVPGLRGHGPWGSFGLDAELLEWKIFKEEPNHVTLAPPDGVAYLAIQSAPDYYAPCGRRPEGRRGDESHLDVEVGELDDAIAEAIELGRRPSRK